MMKPCQPPHDRAHPWAALTEHSLQVDHRCVQMLLRAVQYLRQLAKFSPT